jgi:malate dehydrogenase (oxaloacetate-decarboxylating)
MEISHLSGEEPARTQGAAGAGRAEARTSADAPLPVTLRGRDLIREPLLNKGTAFSARERAELGLEGLLPDTTLTMEDQARRILDNLERQPDPLEKYVALAALQDRNEHLFFHVLGGHLEALMPIVYTPTVGLATQRFSHVFQRGRGVWITPSHRGRIRAVLRAALAGRRIRLIVATDNESILGIGDQGAGGMAISIGKLALYTAIAGINPAEVLPVSLDVGTDNRELLDDPLYLGLRQPRLRGAPYDELVAEFVAAVAAECPEAVIQWEDLRKETALKVLDRHRRTLPSFNDDIQGTGAVGLAGLLAAGRITGRSILEERIIIHGAGAAGLGITRQIRSAMAEAGGSPAEIRGAIAVLDSRGLLVDDGSVRDDYKRELAWPAELAESRGLSSGKRTLLDVVRAFRPTALIGTSGQPGSFDEQVVRAMAEREERPVILPLSNPDTLAEALPADLLEWTAGRALVATGSPFGDVVRNGRRHRFGQGNNAFIFPAVGLAAIIAGARTLEDELFSTASVALAGAVTREELEQGLLYPPIARAPEVCREVAAAVLARIQGTDLAEARNQISKAVWVPRYREYVAA